MNHDVGASVTGSKGLLGASLLFVVALLAIATPASAGGSPDSSSPGSADYRYDPAGDYLGLATRPAVTNAPAGQGGPFTIDPENGIAGPGENGESTFSAASDAWYGLWHYTKWTHTGKPRQLHQAKRAGRWIMEKKAADGLYHVTTGYTLDYEPLIRLEPGWYGAVGQGMALSMFSRLYRATGNKLYLRFARSSLGPLTKTKPEGGVIAPLLDTDLPFLEGYASLPYRFHTLTHHAHALVGLYDMSQYSDRAAKIFRGGMKAMIRALPEYDLGDRVAVWLLHRTHPELQPEPLILGGWHQEVMLPALRALQSVSPDPTLASYIEKWEGQLPTICQDPAELCYYH